MPETAAFRGRKAQDAIERFRSCTHTTLPSRVTGGSSAGSCHQMSVWEADRKYCDPDQGNAELPTEQVPRRVAALPVASHRGTLGPVFICAASPLPFRLADGPSARGTSIVPQHTNAALAPGRCVP
jgi:hypothetical protein